MGVMAAVQQVAEPGVGAPVDAAPDEQIHVWPGQHVTHDGWRAADLETLPRDDGLRYEIVDGLLIVSPSPARRHQWALVALYDLLSAACPAGHRIGVAPFDWQIADDTVLQPDIFVVKTPAHVDDEIGTPLLIVEIASPSTARVDRTLKFETYAEAGVRQYWIMHPGGSDQAGAEEPAAVEVYDLAEDAFVLQGRAAGRDGLAVTGPIAVSVIPDALLDL